MFEQDSNNSYNNFNGSNNSYGYNNNNTDPFYGERKGLATASIICGIASLPLAYMTGVLGCMLGLMAVFFGIFAKGGARLRSSKSVAGIITGAIGAAFGAFMFVYALNYMTNHYDELMSMLEGYESFLNQ